jgi:hypothetical protein
MLNLSHLDSEEDVKAKIIAGWLSAHGFGPHDVSLEASFKIRLGRSEYLVESEKGKDARGRADYLLRACDGRNLIVIEVKAPDQRLDDASRDQAISYARLLASGGIAPFVLLTNGIEARIFDTITREKIDTHSGHPHIENGFCVAADDIKLRAEAMELFVSLSPENFMAFCRSSVLHHMDLLRSEDLGSEKKYIPRLCVRRKDASQRLKQIFGASDKTIALVTGPPQIGKTNFLCQWTEDQLTGGEPCLFYPAVSIGSSLLTEIQGDFEWIFTETASVVHVVSRLRTILGRLNARLTIVIDGWNEADQRLAFQLNTECQRLSGTEIRIILSTTSIAASRLLFDHVGNSAFVADQTRISSRNIGLVEVDAALAAKHLDIVSMDHFTSDETEEAYALYSAAFSVSIPKGHRETREPFLLGLAMRESKNAELPVELDESRILEASLERKLTRARAQGVPAAQDILRIVAEKVSLDDGPVDECTVLDALRLPLTERISHVLFEAALLTQQTQAGRRYLDFYYSRERDFVFAFWVRDWRNRLRTFQSAIEEISRVVTTGLGANTFRWFLSRDEHEDILRFLWEKFEQVGDPLVRRLLVSVLIDTYGRDETGDAWRAECSLRGLRDPNPRVGLESVKLLACYAEDGEELARHIVLDRESVLGLLNLDAEYPFMPATAGEVVLNALREIHHSGSPESGEDELTMTLEEFLGNDDAYIRRAAASTLAFVDCEVFCQCLARKLSKVSRSGYADDYYFGTANAEHAFAGIYYGGMCRGYLYVLEDEPEARILEYEKMLGLLKPIVDFYGIARCRGMVELLAALRPGDYSGAGCLSYFDDPGQLRLQLDEMPRSEEP